jgi:hypothetical protein
MDPFLKDIKNTYNIKDASQINLNKNLIDFINDNK